jgi:hypothetical protein
MKYVPLEAHTTNYHLVTLLATNSFTPPDWCQYTTCLLHKKGNPALIYKYRPIAFMNNLLKLWTALIKEAG